MQLTLPLFLQPACALSQVEFLRLQVRQLNRHMALLQVSIYKLHAFSSLWLATKHIAVVALTMHLSHLQLHKEQEEAHHMYLLCQQLRKKVGLLADVKVPQQSGFHFYIRIMQFTTTTVWVCTCRQVTVPSGHCIHIV